jgi:AraC family transcriptional regulator, transcriptional activator FtrA
MTREMRIKVAAYAFEGMSPFHLSVPALVFGQERELPGFPRYEFHVFSDRPGKLPTNGGFAISVEETVDAAVDADILIVPSWPGPDAEASPRLLRMLRDAHARGAEVAGLCLGAFALAQAGLLDGRRATTHWAYADRLASDYPAALVAKDGLYVEQDGVTTSAGVVAALDCCIHIVRRHAGVAVARQLARHIVLPPHRQGGQSQYLEQPVDRIDERDHFAKAVEGAARTLDQPHTLDSMAAAARCIRRTFTRRFKRKYGVSFGDWLTEQRLYKARELLESSERGIDDIAHQCGLGSAATLRRLFSERFRTSPSQHRREFRGTAA